MSPNPPREITIRGLDRAPTFQPMDVTLRVNTPQEALYLLGLLNPAFNVDAAQEMRTDMAMAGYGGFTVNIDLGYVPTELAERKHTEWVRLRSHLYEHAGLAMDSQRPPDPPPPPQRRSVQTGSTSLRRGGYAP